MRALFLGEGTTAQNGSLVMGTTNGEMRNGGGGGSGASMHGKKDTIAAVARSRTALRRGNIVQHFLEVWDYIGSGSFRGFVVNRAGEKDMFMFFDRAALVRDLKPGCVSRPLSLSRYFFGSCLIPKQL